MQIGAITQQIDVAQLVLVTFFLFFLGLVFYLQRESNREGLPLVNDFGQKTGNTGISGMPSEKVFILPHGGTVTAPRFEPEQRIPASNSASFLSAPLDPIGNKMLSAMGPSAYALRADVPDVQYEDGTPRIVPLRVATDLWIAEEDTDPRGGIVVGADDAIAGTVADIWVDRGEKIIRYLEIQTVAELGARRVLVPMEMVDVQDANNRIKVYLILGAQFADAPGLKNPDQVTLLEEDKIVAYYGGGLLYATPARQEPLI